MPFSTWSTNPTLPHVVFGILSASNELVECPAEAQSNLSPESLLMQSFTVEVSAWMVKILCPKIALRKFAIISNTPNTPMGLIALKRVDSAAQQLTINCSAARTASPKD
jgi:hypothetical protein